jgi:hypothetical protein
LLTEWKLRKVIPLEEDALLMKMVKVWEVLVRQEAVEVATVETKSLLRHKSMDGVAL